MALRKHSLVSSFSLPRSRLDRSLPDARELAAAKEQCHVCGKRFGLTRKRRICSRCGKAVCSADSLGPCSACVCSSCRTQQVDEKVAAVFVPLLNKRHARLEQVLADQAAIEQKISTLKESASITESLNASVTEQFHAQSLKSEEILKKARQDNQSLEDELHQLEEQLAQGARQKKALAQLQKEKETLTFQTKEALNTVQSLDTTYTDLLRKFAAVLQYQELKKLLCKRCCRQVQTQGNKLVRTYSSAPLCLDTKACGGCYII